MTITTMMTDNHDKANYDEYNNTIDDDDSDYDAK